MCRGSVAVAELTEALSDLTDAREAVAAQEDAVADFLESAYSNEFVAAETTDGDDAGTDVSAADVTEQDITEAHAASAAILVGNASIAESAADFNALSDAAQDARIATAQTDLDAAIATAQGNVDTSAEELEAGVVSLTEEAQEKATALETALDAQDAQDTATDEAYAAAGAVATASVGGTPAAVKIEDAASNTLGQVQATDDTDTVVFTSVSESGEVSFTDAVVLNEAGTEYTITLGTGVTTTVTKTYLDAALAAAQSDVDAAADVTAAENALASSMVDVLEAQDSEFDGSDADYASLFADGAIAVTNNVAADDSVALDYSKATDNATTPASATGAADVDTYAVELGDLEGAQADKTAFEEALADWQGTEALVDELASLNSDLEDLNEAVTDAQAAIENDEDADPAGLGVTLLEGNESFTTEDDVYFFAESEGDQTLTNFGDSGEDQIYFGEGFSLVEIAEGSDINDNVGDAAAQEILWQQDGDNLMLYVENETFGGNSAGTADVTTIQLTGVSAEDVNFENGFLSAGTAEVA